MDPRRLETLRCLIYMVARVCVGIHCLKPEKVKPTEEVLYSEKIQLVRVREVAPTARTDTQELHETGFRYESSIIHVNRPS